MIKSKTCVTVGHMTREDLDAVLERVRSWPEPRQEDALAILLTLESEAGATYVLSDSEHLDLVAAIDEVDRGEIASADEVSEVFGRYQR